MYSVGHSDPYTDPHLNLKPPQKLKNQKKYKIKNPKKYDDFLKIETISVSNVQLNQHDLPILEINNELTGTIEALVDSGASRNFVSQAFINQHHLNKEVQINKKPVSVTAANGDTIRNIGLITLDFSFDLNDSTDTIQQLTFYVLDQLAHDLILGIPFITDYGNQIDWANLHESSEHTIEAPEIIEGTPNDADKESDDTFMDAHEELHTEDLLKDELTTQELNHNPQLGINLTTAREVRRQINNKNNYAALLYVQSLETTSEAINTSEEPMEGTEFLRKKIEQEFADVVTNESPRELPPKRNLTHRIILIEPLKHNYRRQYKLSYEEKKELNSQVEELLAQGFIKPSTSPFNSPVLFVKKKDGTLRMCVDYRLLNNNTVKDKFPLPRIEELTTCFGNATVFSKLDLMSGYFQVRVDEEDMEKTAFSTDHGHYEWVVMPFGLTNAPSTFQRMMNQVLAPFINKFVQVYLDDIIIYSSSVEEHYHHLRKILQLLRENHLIAKKKKCSFYFKSLQFLGHIIAKEGIQTDPAKISKIRDWPTPTTIKEAQSFLGLSGYYRRFIKDYSKIAAPIMDYITKKKEWGSDQEQAFAQLKQKLTRAPILIHPIWDPGYTFVVHTDACGSALGYVLEQLDPNGKIRGVIAYGSKKLIGSQLNYSIYDREFLAVVEALRTWRYYLLNRHFLLKTDHHSLIYLKNQNLIDSTRVARWLDYLAQYDFSIEYVKGPVNSVADALSRYPYASAVNCLSIHAMQSALAPNERLKAEIIESYSQDVHFGQLYDILKNSKEIPKTIHHYIKHFRLQDGLLYYSTIIGDDYNRIVVPPHSDVIRKLMRTAHEIPAAGHFGFLKTYERLNKLFYWPHMLKSIKKYCQRCLTCQKNKPETTGQKGLFAPLPIPEGRWTDITLDFVTGIPKSKHGFDMILVVIDRFTKMAHFIPTVKELTAEGCARLMVDYCFKYHGTPKRMVSDKDIRFVNKFWETIHKLFGTTVLYSTTNHPETDGQTERTNRILNQLLRVYTDNDIYGWDDWLSVVEFAYNSAHQVSIGMSPFELCLGYLPDSPTFLNNTIDYNRYSNKAEEFATRMKLIMQQVKDNLVLAQRDQELHHNRSRSPDTFDEGDWILLHKDAYGIDPLYNKIQPVYYGPYQLIKKISDNAFEVDLPRTNKKDRVINVKWFRRFLQDPHSFWKVPPRNLLEAEQRLTEIIAIAGIDAQTDSLDVYWRDCDPCHSSKIPFSLFLKLPEDLQATLWQNARRIADESPTRISQPLI